MKRILGKWAAAQELDTDTTLDCKECGKTFANSANLRRHITLWACLRFDKCLRKSIQSEDITSSNLLGHRIDALGAPKELSLLLKITTLARGRWLFHLRHVLLVVG